jgi:hypothetical protein
MYKTKKISHNGNGKISAEDTLHGAFSKEHDDEDLRKILQRAVNRENAPESLKEMISRKIRQ